MYFATLVCVAVVATVVRARRAGMPWIDVISFPSQWFNWTFFGRDFTEPFSAFVGYQMRENAFPRLLWVTLGYTLDVLFRPRERHHCAQSLWRMEKSIRDGLAKSSEP